MANHCRLGFRFSIHSTTSRDCHQASQGRVVMSLPIKQFSSINERTKNFLFVSISSSPSFSFIFISQFQLIFNVHSSLRRCFSRWTFFSISTSHPSMEKRERNNIDVSSKWKAFHLERKGRYVLSIVTNWWTVEKCDIETNWIAR